MSRTARSYWLREPGSGEIRSADLPDPGPGEVLVRTLVSGVSRGTEALVFRGGVPESQYAAMRAPFQEGDFPGPVKYGYLNVGVVESGPGRPGRPHRLLPPPPPDGLRRAGRGGHGRPRRRAGPPRRARRHPRDGRQRPLGRPAPGRRPGRGRRRRAWSGCASARLLAGVPGVEVTVVDTDGSRADVAEALGARFARPADAPAGLDLVVHASGTVRRAPDLARPARRRRRRHRPQLVRRRPGRAPPRRPLPLRAARRPGQPGGRDRRGPPRPAHPRRPDGAGPAPARPIPPSTRCSPASRRSRSCPR